MHDGVRVVGDLLCDGYVLDVDDTQGTGFETCSEKHAVGVGGDT